MVDISVKLDAYEGPIGLLYSLIEKNEIDIYDIPIAQIADQYMEIVSTLPPDMESLSLFLVMAATLLEIKAKMLLPSKKSDEEDIDPREELVRRLLEYKKFKEISEILQSKSSGYYTVVYKEQDKTVKDILALPEQEIDKLLEGVDIAALFAVFTDVLNRRELKVDKIRASFNSVKKDEFTIEKKIAHLKSVLKFRKSLRFSELFSENSDKPEIVVTFLALLELIKQKEVEVKQVGVFKEIVIETKESGL
ncbi:MAG: segregation/condensation protein A [Defluviitaleaceae bacterium]|nr:segregation/condensation protein A [Defluviitaleaceae bacterium]